MKHVLFVCIENSNRSQMAEGFAHIYGGNQIHAYSAGSRPSGKVNPKAITAMKEIGYDLSTHTSKSLEDLPALTYDAVITMGCGDECPWIETRIREDWNIPDPKEMNERDFNEVRDEIRSKVVALLDKL